MTRRNRSQGWRGGSRPGLFARGQRRRYADECFTSNDVSAVLLIADPEWQRPAFGPGAKGPHGVEAKGGFGLHQAPGTPQTLSSGSMKCLPALSASHGESWPLILRAARFARRQSGFPPAPLFAGNSTNLARAKVCAISPLCFRGTRAASLLRMDPLTLSTTLATLVGLLCSFRQEKGAAADLDHRKFVEWLESHRHEDIKNLISNTHHLQSEIDAILLENQERQTAKLNGIEEMLSRLLSRVDGFREVVRTLHPECEFSEQALDILGLFAASEAERLVLQHGSARFALIPQAKPGQAFKPGEPQFFQDDLNQLVASGFFSTDFNPSGDVFYRLTRAGLSYARQCGAIEKHREGLAALPSEASPA